MGFARRLLLASAAALLAGCGGGSSLKLVPVSGTVKLDNQPLKDGMIVFTREGEAPREIAIADGKFRGEAYAGQNHIQFAAYRPLGKPKASAGPGADEGVSMENTLPARYNQESKEFKEVTAGGPNEFHFELTSK